MLRALGLLFPLLLAMILRYFMYNVYTESFRTFLIYSALQLVVLETWSWNVPSWNVLSVLLYADVRSDTQ